MEVRNLGRYEAYVEIEGHRFWGRVLRKGGLEIYKYTIPPDGRRDLNGRSPYHRDAKIILGSHFAERKKYRGKKARSRVKPIHPVKPVAVTGIQLGLDL